MGQDARKQLEWEEFETLALEMTTDPWDAGQNVERLHSLQHVEMTAAVYWVRSCPEKTDWTGLGQTSPGGLALVRENYGVATATWHCDRLGGPQPLQQLLLDVL